MQHHHAGKFLCALGGLGGKCLLATALAFLSATPAAAIPGMQTESAWRLGGYVKYLAFTDPVRGESGQLLHHRLNLEWQPKPTWTFYAALRNRLFFGETADDLAKGKVGAEDPGYWDLSRTWHHGGDYALNSNVDRLYMQHRHANWQWRFGRQRVNWGMSKLWNPNDLFNAFSIFDFDYEEKPGSDGLLLSRQLDVTAGLELMWAFAGKKHRPAKALRYFSNHRSYDWQGIAGELEGKPVIGGGWAGAVGGMGWHGESTWFKQSSGYDFLFTSGVDYLFGNKVLGRLDVLYNAHPQSLPDVQRVSAKNLSFSRWTLHAEMAFDLTDLQRVSVGGAWYSDGSLYLTASDVLSLADNWGLLFLAQYFTGSGDSVFGQEANHIFFMRLRWSY